MIYYNSNKISDWNLGDDNIIKVYKGVQGAPPTHDYSKDYLTFVAETDNVTFVLSNGVSSNVFQYSLDSGSTWNDLRIGQTSPSINNGEKILFKAASGLSINNEAGIGTIRPSASASVEGNIMSLVYGDNFSAQTTITSNLQLRKLFSGATNITSAENMVLPATTLSKQCYSQMFQGCTSLLKAPKTIGSSAMTWNGDYTMSDMFHGCTSLTTVSPNLLPALNLGKQCYWYMFEDCSSLTTAPQLLAPTINTNSYNGIFKNCSSLNNVTCLATNPSTSNTNDWLYGVAPSGTFTKAANSSWTSGTNGIPNGWTVQDYVEQESEEQQPSTTYTGVVCYYKIVTSGGTTSQTPCYAVVDDISQYSDTEFEDVFNNADGKWYKLNNLNEYEEYGLYGNNITSETTYQGKLSIYDGYEYIYSGSSWTSVGEVSGSTRLPQGYTEVEYLENIQGRYAMIDTGFKPNQDTRVVCEMQNVTSQMYSRYIGAGHWNWTNGDIGWQFDYEDNYNGRLHISWGSIKGWKTYSVTGDYLKHKYDWNKNEFYRDDVLVASVSYTNFQCGSNLGIFNKISSGDSMQNNEALWGKLYSFQLYDNGTLIRDLVPCKRDYDNMYGAYDIVNDQFYYSNTISGYTNNTFYEFSGGSATTQVTYPLYYTEKSDPPSSVSFSSMTEAEEYECPYVGLDADIDGTDYIFDENYNWVTKYGLFEVSGYVCDSGDKYQKMEEKVRNVDDTWSSQDPPVYEKGALIESASTDCSCRLPMGYTEIEYIENTSTAYINLGVKLNQTLGTSYSISTKIYSEYLSSGFGYLIGDEGTSSPYNGMCLRWNAGRLECVFVPTTDGTYVNVPNSDGTSAITISSEGVTQTNNVDLSLFCGIWSSGPWRNGKGRIYTFSLTMNNELVRDLVPAKRDSDNVVGLYDIVNDTFYTSPNGVSFVGGAVVPCGQVDYVS